MEIELGNNLILMLCGLAACDKIYLTDMVINFIL